MNRCRPATSPDGANRTKDPAKPVLSPGPSGSWDSKAIYAPTAIQNGTSYHLWYTAQDAGGSMAIGRATSLDGSIWTKDPANPNVLPGDSGAWDSAGLGWPSVVHDGAAALYHMTYTGYDGAQNTFGYASSSDGGTWEKHAANPVLRPGTGANWDSDWIFDSTVLHNGVAYEMWYTGQKDGAYAIGRAFTEAPIPVAVRVYLPLVPRNTAPVWRVGEVMHTFEAPEEEAIGLAWDGAYLRHLNGHNRFYQLEPTGGQDLQTIDDLSWGTYLPWDGMVN